jgi:hypothetical protein
VPPSENGVYAKSAACLFHNVGWEKAVHPMPFAV